jgi:hypothetical protein
VKIAENNRQDIHNTHLVKNLSLYGFFCEARIQHVTSLRVFGIKNIFLHKIGNFPAFQAWNISHREPVRCSL